MKDNLKDIIEEFVKSKNEHIDSWRIRETSKKEMISQYEIRANWFEKRKGEKSAFFEKVLKCLYEIELEYIYVISFEYLKGGFGFGISTGDKVDFYSGRMRPDDK